MGLSDSNSEIPFNTSDIIQITHNSVLYDYQQRLINEYGIDCYIINRSGWGKTGPPTPKGETQAPAGAYKGKVKGDGERDTVISKGRADIFSEEFKKEVETDDFIQKYKTITNEETLRTAADELDREGNEGVQNWLALAPERASVVDIVKGLPRYPGRLKIR